jgi:hypothetical protein
MTPREPDREPPPGPTGRFADDLIGLDPQDPEVQAFVEHLDRTERAAPGFTVEGYLDDVRHFADSANRATGQLRLAAVVVVGLILLGVGYTVWNSAVFALSVLFAAR